METRIVKVHFETADRSTLKAVSRMLVDGGVCVLPTDTIYGLHCRADRPDAVRELLQLKRRPADKPLVVLVPSPDFPARAGIPVPPLARPLMDTFWPGPLTLVLPDPGVFPPEVTAGQPSVALRYPGYPILQKILEYAGVPLVSTSVNVSGEEPLQTVEEIIRRFGGRVRGILDAGVLEPRRPSTLVSLVEDPPRVIREGAIPASFIRLETVDS